MPRPSTLMLLVCLAFSAALVMQSPLRLVGDGPEYFEMAERLSLLTAPSLPIDDARARGLEYRSLRTADGRQVLPHIWFYPALVAPFMMAARAMNLDALWSFTAANVLFYGLTLWLASRRFHPATIAFLGLGPVLWWLDKGHTEVYAFGLLVVVASTLSTRVGVALVAAALLTAQNPQAMAFFGVTAAYAVRRWRDNGGASTFTPARALLLSASVAMAAANAAYYLWRIGRFTPLLEGQDLRIPAVKTASAVVLDLNIGLVTNVPLVALVVCASAFVSWTRGVRWRAPEWVLVALTLPLLAAFAQTMNVNHGGTPGMSRYVLWLLPLTAPLVDAAVRLGRKPERRGIVALIAGAAVWNLAFFAPARGEGFLQPTAIAEYQWRHYPDLLNPLPEIFAERVRHQESVNTFAAIEGCSKALLQSGQWPHPCALAQAPIPPKCRPDGVLCYANRTQSGYAFYVVSRRGGWSLPYP